MKIACLQPFIPHYREEFIKGLVDQKEMDVYCYDDPQKAKGNLFHLAEVPVKLISSINFGPFLFYNPWPFIRGNYDQMILMLHYGHLTTWMLLIWNKIRGKRTILWGQGISVKRYLKESKSLPFLMKWMISLADVVWLYTSAEVELWKPVFPNKKIIALNNTISEVEKLMSQSELDKESVKKRFGIKQNLCLIFCARFGHAYRRTDVLVDLIEQVNSEKVGFIIIGGGEHKPDFSKYPHVYDFGAVYDRSLKDQLFSAADLYIQPGWVGLSVVEALAYGKPVLTLKRTADTLQCVEYAYLVNGYNAFICSDVNNMLSVVNGFDDILGLEMKSHSKKYVQEHLMMSTMISNAVNSLEL